MSTLVMCRRRFTVNGRLEQQSAHRKQKTTDDENTEHNDNAQVGRELVGVDRAERYLTVALLERAKFIGCGGKCRHEQSQGR